MRSEMCRLLQSLHKPKECHGAGINEMNEKSRRLKRSTVFNLFIAGLWSLLTKVAFHLLPLLPALLISAASFVLLMFVFFPHKRDLEQDFKEELAESKRTWKTWNR